MIHASRFWIFHEDELAPALDAYIERQIAERDIRPDYGAVFRSAVNEFLYSAELRDAGMCRGGNEQ